MTEAHILAKKNDTIVVLRGALHSGKKGVVTRRTKDYTWFTVSGKSTELRAKHKFIEILPDNIPTASFVTLLDTSSSPRSVNTTHPILTEQVVLVAMALTINNPSPEEFHKVMEDFHKLALFQGQRLLRANQLPDP